MSDPLAEQRTRLHDGQPSQRILSRNHDAVGFAGELAFSNRFHVPVDLALKARGDGGCDFLLHTCTGTHRVDVKTSRTGDRLLVEACKLKPHTIYVLAVYNDILDSAYLRGWEWASIIAQVPPRDTGRGVINHAIDAHDLRPIEELLAATYAPGEKSRFADYFRWLAQRCERDATS